MFRSSKTPNRNPPGRTLADYQGNAFNGLPVSSLSWRYLGLFLDNNCSGGNNRRKLADYNEYNNVCRKVLWAAYYDPEYERDGVAEYSYYDRSTESYDSSTCYPIIGGQTWPGTRCRRLDCHEEGTTLELLGVFKETDGLVDFTEQLFKHQGYCLWDEDKNQYNDGSNGSSDYQFMQNLRKNLVYGCTQTVDADGNVVYYDTKPLPGGDMTYGVYTDASCSVESKLTWEDMLANNNVNQYNHYMPSMDSLDRWNERLGDWKICQPCRAYNRVQINAVDGDVNYEEGEDGEGGRDPWGFDCYDDAGYQNCNQCYKFQTQTDMEQASVADLELATEQGTILEIEVDGVTYGSGRYNSANNSSSSHSVRRMFVALLVFAVSMLMIAFAAKVLAVRGLRKRRKRSDRSVVSSTLRGPKTSTKKSKKKKKKKGKGDLAEPMLTNERGRSIRPKLSFSRSRSRSRSICSTSTGLAEF